MPTTIEKRAAFRRLHDGGFFIIPNAWDAGSAVRLTKLGFRAIASTSSGAAWAAGKDDGEMSRDEVLAHLRLLVEATPLPVNADFENGFADSPAEVATHVAMAAETGVAGISIEDWSGHEMYALDLAVERIAAARAGIDRVDPNVMLIGRNENFRVPGMSASDSVARSVAYAEAGADCLFVPMIVDPGAVSELVAAVAPKPVNVLVRNFDANIRAFAALGVRRCSVGGSLAQRAWAAFDDAATVLRSCEQTKRADAPSKALPVAAFECGRPTIALPAPSTEAVIADIWLDALCTIQRRGSAGSIRQALDDIADAMERADIIERQERRP